MLTPLSGGRATISGDALKGILKRLASAVTVLALLGMSCAAGAADLDEINARGQSRFIGPRHAPIAGGEVSGFEVGLFDGFVRKIGVNYWLGYPELGSVIRHLPVNASQERAERSVSGGIWSYGAT